MFKHEGDVFVLQGSLTELADQMALKEQPEAYNLGLNLINLSICFDK